LSYTFAWKLANAERLRRFSNPRFSNRRSIFNAPNSVLLHALSRQLSRRLIDAAMPWPLNLSQLLRSP
ncbi:MAG TPA: hypothetical protein VIQ48_01875, partial [Rhodanobacter sp.]